MDLAVQKSPCCQHHGACAKADTHLRHRTHHAVALDHQIVYRLLKKREVGLVFNAATNRCLVQNAVGLGTRGTHRRAFGAIQDTKLNTALVGSNRHCTAQRIHLFDEVALADAANAGVAAHLAQRFNVVGQQQSLCAHARRRQRRLGARVAATDHDHVKFFGVIHSAASTSSVFKPTACAACACLRSAVTNKFTRACCAVPICKASIARSRMRCITAIA